MKKEDILFENFVATMIRPNGDVVNTTNRTYGRCIETISDHSKYGQFVSNGYEFFITEV